MAAALYTRLEATAKRLISQYGYTTQLQRAGVATGPDYDPQPGAPTLHDCKVVETSYSLTNRDATLVLTGDKLGLISTDVDTVPLISDVLMLSGEPYRFIELQPLNPGGLTLLYEFQCRK